MQQQQPAEMQWHERISTCLPEEQKAGVGLGVSGKQEKFRWCKELGYIRGKHSILLSHPGILSWDTLRSSREEPSPESNPWSKEVGMVSSHLQQFSGVLG